MYNGRRAKISLIPARANARRVRGDKNTENLRARYIKHEPARLKSKIFAGQKRPSTVLSRTPFVFGFAPGRVCAFLRFGACERVTQHRA